MFKRLCVAVLARCVGYGADLLQQCNSGDDKACKKLGQQCESGDVRACGKIVFSAHYRLCNDGDGAICENLAYEYVKIKDYTKAIEYFQKACNLGEQSSCDRAKVLKAGEYLRFNGLQNDEEFMKQLEQKMQECDNGNTRICQSILALIEPLCNTNGDYACYVVGVVYSSENRDVQNYHKAKEYFQKACDMKFAPACFNLGSSYALGKGARQNLSNAMEYFGKACDYGLQQGCDNYKMIRGKLNIR